MGISKYESDVEGLENVKQIALYQSGILPYQAYAYRGRCNAAGAAESPMGGASPAQQR